MISVPLFSELLLGDVRISLYGLLISLGLLVAYSVSILLARRTNLAYHVDRMLVWMLIPAIIGARALFVAYHANYFFIHPSEIIAVWHGGWVWHGALIGGLGGIFLYCKKQAISFFGMLDVCAPGVVLGQAIGRWGNFFNQEAYGYPTTLPWKLFIDIAHRIPGYESFEYFHPTFLYEALADGTIFLILLAVINHSRKGRPFQPGVVFFFYLFLYSLIRLGIEYLRIDLVPVILGLRAPQWISLGLIILSGVWLLQKRKSVI